MSLIQMLSAKEKQKNFRELSRFRDSWGSSAGKDRVRSWAFFWAKIEYRFREERLLVDTNATLTPDGTLNLHERDWLRSELLYLQFGPAWQHFSFRSETRRLRVRGDWEKLGEYTVFVRPLRETAPS